MTISVYITCFNKSKFIGEAIESVLNQSLMPKEIIIIDDCSTDGSVEIIKRYIKEYPKLIVPVFNRQNRGITETRNIALKKCTGDIITFLDGDDYYYKEKLEREYNALVNSNAHAVYSNFHYVNEGGKITGQFAEAGDSPAEGDIFLNTFGRIYNVSSGNNYIYEMFYRDCLDESGYYDTAITLWEDWDFRIRFSKKFQYTYCPDLNMVYRKHLEGISRSGEYLHYLYQKRIFKKNTHLLGDISDQDREFVKSRVKKPLEGLLNTLMMDAIESNNQIRAFSYWVRLFLFYNSKKYIRFALKHLLPRRRYQQISQVKNWIRPNK